MQGGRKGTRSTAKQISPQEEELTLLLGHTSLYTDGVYNSEMKSARLHDKRSKHKVHCICVHVP